jgi:hypothetical protein
MFRLGHPWKENLCAAYQVPQALVAVSHTKILDVLLDPCKPAMRGVEETGAREWLQLPEV